jgi:Fe-S-cluster-containing dehydrogenase component
MSGYRLHVDEALCWGCKTCEVACKLENGAPLGVKLITVREEGPAWTGPDPAFTFRVRRCRHCATPPCSAACAAGAISRRADGVVVLDQARCTGCRACLEACPFAAIAWNAAAGVAAKCDLCHHRIDRGLLPACADNVCPAHCIRLHGAETRGHIAPGAPSTPRGPS